MSLTGAVKPTFLYPRITYGSPAVTLDLIEPTSRIPTFTPYQGLRGVNTVASGKREYLFGRGEEQVGLVLRCEQDQLAALRWFVQDFAAEGNQFQTWVDRHTGSCWMFERNLKDQNGLALTLSSGSATYGATTNGFGLTLSGTQYLTVPLAQSTAGTPTGYDNPLSKDDGVVVVDFVPAFAASDSTLHKILDTSGTANRGPQLHKSTANELVLTIVDNASASKQVSGAVTWASSDRVQIVASWSSAGALALWYAVNSGAFVALTTSAGAGTGLLTTLPTTAYIGGDNAGANRAAGTYDSVAFFKRAFASPQQSLANFRPVERNYFPYGELTAASFQPVRVTLGRPIWDWAMTVRNGVA
jgi:hypothetical protein